jgi:phospholipid transport system substrate-binding protein
MKPAIDAFIAAVRRPIVLTLSVGLIFVAGALAPVRSASTPDPMQQTKEAIDQVLAVLRDRQTPIQQRRRELHRLAIEHLDFTDMARSSLGYHWRDLDDDQRKQFTQMFTAFMEESYLDKIQDYSNFDVKVFRKISLGPDSAEVFADVIQEGREPIHLLFSLRRENGQWMIYDVAIDNVSMVANYRNQFNRVINNQGFETLIADLQRKQAQLASLLGQKGAAAQ